ncbi:hypothetical protein [Pararhodobacter sp. SW119]|uniref:hypothetical protein n=1 Tax=Pararhodobacter sp. SW119 TaxID=2780075 RepID=UPI001ADF029A|nr:hypothetical protein [Pararhodobacter sp. SW119]
MFYDQAPATVAQLRQVEEIVVEQEMEMAWEARVRLSLSLDDRGRWRAPPNTTVRPFSRVRIEVRLGERGFRPLIDGPVAGFDTELAATPGSSVVNLVVRDDSVLMNREDDIEVFENRSDASIAEEVFGRFASIAETRMGAATTVHPATVRRGTSIQFLRQLARAYGYLAYVLPGDRPGTSVGVFDAPASQPRGHPALVLLGRARNLQAATFREDAEGPERSSGRVLSITDQQVTASERSYADVALMGDLPPVTSDTAALRELPPEENLREDPETSAAGRARRASYGMRMSATLVPGSYDDVLSPYEVVTVRAGTLPQSGDWLLHKVTHRITPSIYAQEIEAKRNARSDPAAGPLDLGAASGLF